MENIVFFDGVCGLCNKFVDFVICHDKNEQIFFAPLQGKLAQTQIKNLTVDVDYVILYSNGNLYQKSTAAIRILSLMGGIWKCCILFLIIPPFIRNYIYDWVAKNRYKWFGKNEFCRIPSQEELTRFY